MHFTVNKIKYDMRDILQRKQTKEHAHRQNIITLLSLRGRTLNLVTEKLIKQNVL